MTIGVGGSTVEAELARMQPMREHGMQTLYLGVREEGSMMQGTARRWLPACASRSSR